MSFYELGLDGPLEAFIHNPQACTRECCSGTRIRSVTTLAGTLVRPPVVPLGNVTDVADTSMLEAVEKMEKPCTVAANADLYASSSSDTDDLYCDEPHNTGEVDWVHEAQMHAREATKAAADAAAKEASIRALQVREEATRVCVLGVNATGTTSHDCVLQCVIKCYTETGYGVMGYDRLWTIPGKTKISINAYNAHRVHYRDLRASGMPPRQELVTILGVLGRLVKRGVRLIVHNAKPTLRLLEQTAAQNGRKGWKFPFPCTDLATKSKRILNMPAKIDPNLLATPSERDVYAYLHKKQYDDEDDDVTSITDLATTCKIVVLNYLAGVGRGWWD